MKNIKKINAKDAKAGRNAKTREALAKAGTKAVAGCPELGYTYGDK